MMVDAEVGRVLRALDDAQLAKETLLVLTSDNGPCWFDEDVERFGHDSAGGLRGMKADVWEAGHCMPFLVRWPGKVQTSSTSDQLICFTDLLATFADVMGVELPAGAGPDSLSFLPVLQGRRSEVEPLRSQFVMRPSGGAGMMSIRSGDWKLITGLGSGGFSEPKHVAPGPGDPEGQLYNLADDLGERNNLYASEPEIVARLKAELVAVVESEQSRASR